MNTPLVRCVLLAQVFVLNVTPSVAQQNLRGLDSMYVAISDLDECDKDMGLTESSLRVKVELELRKVGIKIMQEFGYPAVAVRIMCLTTTSGGFAFTTKLQVHDYVVRTMDLGKAFQDTTGQYQEQINMNDFVLRMFPHGFAGVIWERNVIQTTPKESARSFFMENLQEFLDSLLNDYLTANPRN